MKRLRQLLVAVAMLIVGVQSAQAQVKLGDNPGTIDANAVLEIESTTKGFLLPRMTTAQRLAIPSVSEGMMVYDLTANCTYVYRASAGQWYSLCSADSLTASNGLTKVGRDVQLGGTLNQITNINQNGNNLNLTGNGSLGVGTNSPNANTRVDIAPNAPTDDPLRLQGLRSGASTDSIMTVNAATGILKKRTLADVLKDQDTLVWKLDGNLVTAVRSLGTKTAFALPIITNNQERMRISATGEVGIGTAAPTNRLSIEDLTNDPLKVVGLRTAAMTDSILTINAATGVVRKITMDSLVSRGITADNGLTKTANNLQLGGTLIRPTALGTSATNTLALTGLQTAAMTDSVVMMNAATGVLRKMTIDSIASQGIVAENAISKEGNILRLGGPLNRPTAIGASAANTLAVTGLQTAAMTDSVVMMNAATGVLRKMTIDSLVSRGITADNGLTKTANNIQLGGTLLHPTTVVQAGNVMAYTGGNVGIGTATAPDRLTVSGNASVTNTGSVTTTLSDGTTLGQLKVTANNTELSSNGTSGMQFSTGASPAARMTVTQAGSVGIATATPNAKFHVAGSMAMPISTQSADYTATLDDHTLILDCTGGPRTLTLPAASSCAGRTYIVIKGDPTGNVLTFSTPVKLSTLQTMPSVNYNVRLHVQSDGTNWWLIARF
jgi:hypothetical protein